MEKEDGLGKGYVSPEFCSSGQRQDLKAGRSSDSDLNRL